MAVIAESSQIGRFVGPPARPRNDVMDMEGPLGSRGPAINACPTVSPESYFSDTRPMFGVP